MTASTADSFAETLGPAFRYAMYKRRAPAFGVVQSAFRVQGSRV